MIVSYCHFTKTEQIKEGTMRIAYNRIAYFPVAKFDIDDNSGLPVFLKELRVSFIQQLLSEGVCPLPSHSEPIILRTDLLNKTSPQISASSMFRPIMNRHTGQKVDKSLDCLDPL